MKLLIYSKKLVVSLSVAGLLIPSMAGAAAPVAQNQIRVTGVVPDRRTIVLRSDLSIEQVFSNTSLDVTPTVTVGWIEGQTMPLTPAIRAQYDQIIAKLQTDKVVTVTAAPHRLPINYPDFTAPGKILVFTVTPTRQSGDGGPSNYEVNVATP